MKIKQKGLALDIDETLSRTNGHWFKTLIKKFGNPEKLTVEEILKNYRYTNNVPYWQAKEAHEWMEEQRHSNDMQRELPLIENANHTVEKINKIIPISAYITVRPDTVIEGTKDWLLQHNFPLAPIICRPKNVEFTQGNKWKANLLHKLYPKILGIIDDNPELLEHLPKDYKGTVFVYGLEKIETKINAIPCKDWNTVLKEVEKKFK